MSLPSPASVSAASPASPASAGASASVPGAAPSPGASLRPPRALPPRKARLAAECQHLEQLPNIGPSIAADLRLLGVVLPAELSEHDPLKLYQRLCEVTGKRQDPCVLDTFMAAVDFMRGAAPRPWWEYTPKRKTTYGAV